MTVNILIYPEAVVHSCSVKKVFLEILQTSTCAGVSFLIKLQAGGLRPTTSLKKILAQVLFCEICQIC